MNTISTHPSSYSTNRMALVLVGSAVLWLAAYNLIQPLANWISYSALQLPRDSRLGESLTFFLYDVPKILLLLSGIIFIISMIRSFFSPERTRSLLGGRREGAGNVLAAMLGTVTPFCSCSAVPLFIGFVTAGIPLGVTFSFLVAAPMVNEVALVLLFGLFGWKIAAIYTGTGLFVAILAGWTIGRLHLERYVESWVYASVPGKSLQEAKLGWSARLRMGWDAVREI